MNAESLCKSATLVEGTLEDLTSPLEKYSLVMFLDQFVHKQAKKSKDTEDEQKAKHRGSSIMQPFSLDTRNKSLAYFQSPQFLQKSIDAIPVEEVSSNARRNLF
jgi:hypothetical protein